MGLYRRSDSDVWWMSFTYNGRLCRKSTGTSDEKLANKIFGKVQTQVIEGKWFDIDHSKEKLLQEMIERYEEEYSNAKDYYQSKRDRSIFKHLYAFFGEAASMKDIQAKVGEYERFRRTDTSKAKPSTIMKELSLLRRMFNVARKQWKWMVNNPVSDIELPKVRDERVRYLSDDEHKRLFEALEKSEVKWLKPLVIIALGTGLRLNNLSDLKWSEVNLFNRMIIIDAMKMKNDDHLGIPITDNILKVFTELQKVRALSDHVFHDDGEKLYSVKVQRAFRKALKSAGIENFHFHDLRHCFCSYLRQQGVDLHTIAVLAGHRDLRMTKRYAHLNVDSLRGAISKIDYTFSSRSDGALHAKTM